MTKPRLDVQQLLHQTYDSADYGKTIYPRRPIPRMSKSDAEWARQFVPAPA